MSGLSKLQKAILQAAMDNRAYLHSDRYIDTENGRYTPGHGLLCVGFDIRQCDLFSLTNTTNKESAKVSISRACSRLQERGLIVKAAYGWTGAAIKLTPAGMATVNKLSRMKLC